MARKKSSEGAPAQAAVPTEAAIPDDSVVYLDSALDIQHIEKVAAGLRERLAGSVALTIDLSRVSNVDTAGVQLLLAFCNEAPGRGVSLEFRGQTAALTQALAVLGLQGQIPAAASHATE
jgi:anti-anti-sigma regulatory factor